MTLGFGRLCPKANIGSFVAAVASKLLPVAFMM